MPVIPTYRTGIGAPNLAEAYLGGRRIQQQAAEAAARIALGREQLAQEAVANEMELAVKREALSRQAMKYQQEQEIEKAYRETQIGLRQRELANEEAIAQMRIQDAARDFERQQAYQRRVASKVAGGMPLEEAARQEILETGGTGLSTALERPRPTAERKFRPVVAQDILQPPTRVEMTGPEFLNWFPTAPAEVRTNAANLAIQSMLQAPATATGTNVPSPSSVAPSMPISGAVQTVTTKAQFDALPQGAEYIGKNGKRYRKP